MFTKKAMEMKILGRILDRSEDVMSLVDKIDDMWLDMYARKPSPEFGDDGEYSGTSMDLLTLIFSLAKRNAPINIPQYRKTRGQTVTEGQHVISSGNRHGKLMSISANKDTFTFSAKIFDQNVMTVDDTGAYRNFTLCDMYGRMWQGLNNIEIMPNKQEKEFFMRGSMVRNGTVNLQHVVPEERWTSLFGRYYFATKLLIQRMDEEAKNLFAQMKAMKEEGYTLPEKDYPKSTDVGDTKKIKVKAFHVELDHPDFTGEFETLEPSQENLALANERRNDIIFTRIPRLRFISRTVELAFRNHIREKGLETYPAWVKSTWEIGFKESPRARKQWNRIQGIDEGWALRFREWDKTETVDVNYPELEAK